MSREFKAGDRISVYGEAFEMKCTAFYATVAKIREEDGWIWAKCDCKDTIPSFDWVHPKQCRRLVRKARRRVWLYRIDTLGSSNRIEILCEPPHGQGWTEFAEVKKK